MLEISKDPPESEPEDQSEDRVYLLDVREFTVAKVRKLRYVDEQTWFPEQRER